MQSLGESSQDRDVVAAHEEGGGQVGRHHVDGRHVDGGVGVADELLGESQQDHLSVAGVFL